MRIQTTGDNVVVHLASGPYTMPADSILGRLALALHALVQLHEAAVRAVERLFAFFDAAMA